MANYQLPWTGDEIKDYIMNPPKVNVYNPSVESISISALEVGTWINVSVPITGAEIRHFTLEPPPIAGVKYVGLPNYITEVVMDGDVEMTNVTSANVTFGLFKTGVHVPKMDALAVFGTNARIKSFGANGLIPMVTNDYFQLKVKSDVAIDLDLLLFKVTLFGCAINE